jgi:type IV pilus assembly protein PilA
MRKRMKGQKGFTLIELLVVIIIIAILAAIAIPTFLGQRQKAQDAAAKSLVRNAMTTIESAYVDTRSFNSATMTVTVLEAIEPSIEFAVGGTCTAVPAITTSLDRTTGAAANTIEYTGTTDATHDEYTVVTMSASGNIFGAYVSKTVDGGTTLVKKLGTAAAAVGW